MSVLNYTTTIPVARTVGEVQAMLAEHGADAVGVRYANRLPVGVSFTLTTPHGVRAFNLPVDVDAVETLLVTQEAAGQLRKAAPRGGWANREQAARVAWRIVKDWLEAQLALIAAEMATLDVVMLPYLVIDGVGGTLAQRYRESGTAALEAAQ